jgi:retron-type reverse transcriptase
MKEENKLIAEFMGYIDNGCSEEGFLIHPKTNYDVEINNLMFHSDWNWLMEVVDKISSELHYSINATLEFLSEEQNRDGLYGIKDVYEAVVEYVKLYNEQK